MLKDNYLIVKKNNLHPNVQNLLVGGKGPGEPLFCFIKQTNRG